MTTTTHSTFDKSSEAKDVAVAFPHSVKDRTILITGVNKLGIGYATAEALATQAPRCIILCGRSQAKVQECVDSLQAQYTAIDVRPLIIDLPSQQSVEAAASELFSWKDVPAIHLLINNAGLMVHSNEPGLKAELNDAGLELMFATNHIGHFLFTNLIMPKLVAAAKDSPTGSVRVVNLSSSGTYVSPLRTSDINFQKPAKELPESERPNFAMMIQAGLNATEDMAYIPTAAYGASKTCNILFAVGLNNRLFEKYGILSLALNPGEVKSELGRNTDSEWFAKVIKKREEMGLLHWKTLGGGASTTLVAVCDPKLSLPESDGTGQYLSDCQIARAPAHATNKEAAETLWKLSEELTGQKFSS